MAEFTSPITGKSFQNPLHPVNQGNDPWNGRQVSPSDQSIPCAPTSFELSPATREHAVVPESQKKGPMQRLREMLANQAPQTGKMGASVAKPLSKEEKVARVKELVRKFPHVSPEKVREMQKKLPLIYYRFMTVEQFKGLDFKKLQPKHVERVFPNNERGHLKFADLHVDTITEILFVLPDYLIPQIPLEGWRQERLGRTLDILNSQDRIPKLSEEQVQAWLHLWPHHYVDLIPEEIFHKLDFTDLTTEQIEKFFAIKPSSGFLHPDTRLENERAIDRFQKLSADQVAEMLSVIPDHYVSLIPEETMLGFDLRAGEVYEDRLSKRLS